MTQYNGYILPTNKQTDCQSNEISVKFINYNISGLVTPLEIPVIKVDYLKQLTRSINNQSGHIISDIDMIDKSTPQYQGSIIKYDIGDRDKKNTGYINLNHDISSRDNKIIQAVIPLINNISSRSNNHEAFNITSLRFDSNSGYKYKLTVTPTRQHKSQIINVECIGLDGDNTIGDYKVYINGEIFREGSNIDLNILIFNIQPEDLIIGRNKVKISYKYPNLVEYVEFEAVKESLKREIVERTFKSYDGGYDGDRMSSSNVINKYPCILIPNDQSRTIITTTENTRIPLEKYAGIVGVTIDAAGARILVSFDNKQTWYGKNLSIVDIGTISENGMTPVEVNGITQSNWSNIFQQTAIDFAVYLDNTLSTELIDINRILLYNFSHNYTGTSSVYYYYDIPNYYRIVSISGGTRDNYISGGNYTTSNGSVYGIREDGTSDILSKNLTSNSWESYSKTYGNDDILHTRILASLYGYGAYPNSDASGTIYVSPRRAYLKSITVTLPPNQAPQLKNINLTPSTVHLGNVQLSGDIIDYEEDDISYKISINENHDLIPWTNIEDSQISFDLTISQDHSPIGTNSIKIETTDNDKSATNYYYFTRTNANPVINAVLNGNVLTATIGDLDNDKIKYRILFNGQVKRDWSELIQSPISIKYILEKEDVIVGYENTLVIEAIDELSGISSADIGFIGNYYNLIFKDINNNILSDSSGNTLKLLNLGAFTIKSFSESTPIKITNTTGHRLKNITIYTQSMNIETQLSLDRFNFEENSTSLFLPGEMLFNDSVVFYTKCTTPVPDVGNKQVTIFATAEII